MVRTNLIGGTFLPSTKVAPASRNNEEGGTMRKETLKKKSMRDGIPVVPSQWKDEIMSQEVKDMFWQEVEKRGSDIAHVGCQENWLFMCNEASVQKRGHIPAESILKFRFERGEFPSSSIKFGSSEVIPGWEEWVEKIMKDANKREILTKAGVLDAIRISTRLSIRREKRMEVWRAILARWSSYSHTMITAWGEFTFTLEDVQVLLELSTMGKDNILLAELSEEEAQVERFFINVLKGQRRKSKHARFSSWVALFHTINRKSEGKACLYQNHPEELVALLMLWLSRYVFPGCPDGGISEAMISIAIKISRGAHFPLGPLYLGSLYARLDLYNKKMETSAGRYIVLSFVDVAFIQMCLWERFRSCAPNGNCYDGRSYTLRGNYRAWAWVYQTSNTCVLEVIDSAEEFEPRPYVKRMNNYEGVSYVGIETQGDVNVADIWMYYWELPSMIESVSSTRGLRDSFSTVVYSPYRVARQFGYDQCAPPEPRLCTNFGACVSSFTHGNFWALSIGNRDLPSEKRKGSYSAGWLAFWLECLVEWKKYATYSSEFQKYLRPKAVAANDIALRLPPKPRKRKRKIIEEEIERSSSQEDTSNEASDSEKTSKNKDYDDQSNSDEDAESRYYQHAESVPDLDTQNFSDKGVFELPSLERNDIENIRTKNASAKVATTLPISTIPSRNAFGTMLPISTILSHNAFGVASFVAVTIDEHVHSGVQGITNGASASTLESIDVNLHRSSTTEASKADFHGFQVASHTLQYLEQLYEKEGKFWDTCIFQSTDLIAYLFHRLGDALVASHIPIEEVAPEKLKVVLQALDDVVAAGFRLGHLKDNMAKVKAFQDSKDERDAIEADVKQTSILIEDLQKKIGVLQLRKQKLEAKLQACPSLHGSSIWNLS